MNCKLPIRSEIYNCTFIKTNKVAIIIPFVFKKKIQYRLNSPTILVCYTAVFSVVA